jgi:hypothetical protein
VAALIFIRTSTTTRWSSRRTCGSRDSTDLPQRLAAAPVAYSRSSWGNDANPHGWNINQPEDMNAARKAWQNHSAEHVGDRSCAPKVAFAFWQLNKPENEHPNGWITNSCKSEANNLLKAARSIR